MGLTDTRPSVCALVAHLYRRAGFGALPDQLAMATAAGYDATVGTLLAGLAVPDPRLDALFELPDPR